MAKGQALFDSAKEYYGTLGVDVERALSILDGIQLGLHAWQGDDVRGFETGDFSLTGGCQVTGSYPGRARTADELRADLDLAMKLIPGHHRVGLQGHQVDRMFPGVDPARAAVGVAVLLAGDLRLVRHQVVVEDVG